MPEVIIRAGRVVDGTGAEPRTADIAIRDGRIAEIGRVRDRAHRVIDADGALVIPGLIALLPPAGVATVDRNRTQHQAPGVTTTLEVAPASSAKPSEFALFMQHLRQERFVTDRRFLFDHDAMRHEVMGNKVRDGLNPADGDLELMGRLLSDAHRAGAVALLTRAEPDEIVSITALAMTQRSAESEQATALAVVVGSETEDVHEIARFLAREEHLSEVISRADTPTEDETTATALVPSGDPVDAFPVGRCIAGEGLNPLALVNSADPDRWTVSEIATVWARTATLFGLDDRGTLESEMQADVNVIDDVYLSDDLASGVVSTLVRGLEIVSDDELTDTHPGQA